MRREGGKERGREGEREERREDIKLFDSPKSKKRQRERDGWRNW